MCTTEPPPDSTITRATRWAIMNAPVRLTSRIVRHSEIGKVDERRREPEPGAVDEHIDPAPTLSCSIDRSLTCSSTATSATCHHAMPPASTIDPATASSSDCVRLINSTSAPSRAARRAVASPIPRPPPESTSRLPANRPGTSLGWARSAIPRNIKNQVSVHDGDTSPRPGGSPPLGRLLAVGRGRPRAATLSP